MIEEIKLIMLRPPLIPVLYSRLVSGPQLHCDTLMRRAYCAVVAVTPTLFKMLEK